MKPKCKIKYSPAAVDGLDEIFSYISHESTSAVNNMLQKLDDSISNLAEFPSMGSVLQEDEYNLISRGYRFITVESIEFLVEYLLYTGFCMDGEIACASCLDHFNKVDHLSRYGLDDAQLKTGRLFTYSFQNLSRKCKIDQDFNQRLVALPVNGLLSVSGV